MDYEEMLKRLRAYLNGLDSAARPDGASVAREILGRDAFDRELEIARELMVEALKSYLRTNRGRAKFMELAASWGK